MTVLSFTDIGLDCNFSGNNLCNYMMDEQGHFSWMLNKGRTPSLNTGPLTDHTSRNDIGKYEYLVYVHQHPLQANRL